MYMVIAPNMLKLGYIQKLYEMKIAIISIFSKVVWLSAVTDEEKKMTCLHICNKISKFNPVTMSSSGSFQES